MSSGYVEVEDDNAFWEGRTAFCEGLNKDYCPYPEDHPQFYPWIEGWNAAELEL